MRLLPRISALIDVVVAGLMFCMARTDWTDHVYRDGPDTSTASLVAIDKLIARMLGYGFVLSIFLTITLTIALFVFPKDRS